MVTLLATAPPAAFGRRSPPALAPLPLVPLIAEYTTLYGATWSAVTRRKHRDDYARLVDWLTQNELPVTTAALDFRILVRFVEALRSRPRVAGVWRGTPDARVRSLAQGPGQTLSANSVNAYVRPIRSLCIWLVDEGLLAVNPFRRSRRRAALNPLLPAEETPTKGASLADLRALEAGCAGERPLDLRDRAIVAILVTTAARNSSVRLLRLADVDLARELLCFRRAKGGKTLEVALHAEAARAIAAYLAHGRGALLARAPADEGYLFLARGGGGAPLRMNALSLMLTRRYRRAGGLGYFGSHRIRHATATLLVNNGMGLEEVSRYLGHSSTGPTRRYAVQSPASLGRGAAAALARAGLAE